jgi:hypothetical protein
MAFGLAIAFPLYARLAPAGVALWPFALFMSVALSITAFPVMARILKDRGATQTTIGRLALTSAAVADVAAWAMLARLREELTLTLDLNAALQTFMREWSRVSEKRNEAILLDQAALGWFAELNRGLQDDLDDAGFKARWRETTAQLQALAAEIVLLALADHPQLDAARVRALLGDDLSRLAGTLLFSAVRRDRSVAA